MNRFLKRTLNLFNRIGQNAKIEGASYAVNPNRVRFSRGGEKTMITSIYNRIAIDAATIDIRHVILDEQRRFKDTIDSELDNCLSVEANIDQTSRSFMQDAVSSLIDEGCIAIVPVDVEINDKGETDILSLRTGKIVQWAPDTVTVNIYNDKTGIREDVRVYKNNVAIIENPLYAIMNEHNSTLQRLVTKLALMDSIDAESGSGNLDLIIQLPYVVKTEAKKQQATERRLEIESQLKDSKYGVAYIDGTEKVTQLNRPVENNLMKQIEYLVALLHSQLGITQAIMDGSADEQTMNNYYTRTIEPIIGAIVDEMNRKFISRAKRQNGERIQSLRNPFKLIPVSSIPDIADKLTRNEIMSSNEIRQIIGLKPSSDPNADELRNKNLNKSNEEILNVPSSSKEENDDKV